MTQKVYLYIIQFVLILIVTGKSFRLDISSSSWSQELVIVMTW